MNGHIFFLFYVLLYDYLFISRNHIFRIRMLSICFIGGHIGIAKIIIKKKMARNEHLSLQKKKKNLDIRIIFGSHIQQQQQQQKQQ